MEEQKFKLALVEDEITSPAFFPLIKILLKISPAGTVFNFCSSICEKEENKVGELCLEHLHLQKLLLENLLLPFPGEVCVGE